MANDSCTSVTGPLKCSSDTVTLVVVPLYVLVSVLSVIGNFLVMASVWRFRVLRTPTNNLVVALAVADLVVGLNIAFYISFFFDVDYVLDPVACGSRYFIALWSTVLSMVLLVAVAVDRYVCILHPLRYSTLVSQRVSRIAVLLIYVYVTLVVSLPYVCQVHFLIFLPSS